MRAEAVNRHRLMPITLLRLADQVAAREQIEVPLAVNGSGHGRTAPPVLYALSLHDALPISRQRARNDTVAEVAVSVGILELRPRDGAGRVVAEVLVGRRAQTGRADV